MAESRPRSTSHLCTVTMSPGQCVGCRHANQGTVDFEEGLVICQWDQKVKSRDHACDARMPARTDAYCDLKEYFLFEPFDGSNSTWSILQNARILAEDADEQMREALHADKPVMFFGDT